MFGCDERFEWRADDLNGRPVLIDRTPGGYEAGIAVKPGTVATLITDHEREAVTCRIPHLDILDGSDDATELHGAPQKRPLRRTHPLPLPPPCRNHVLDSLGNLAAHERRLLVRLLSKSQK
jgi:hypothetical protein